jgi:hypothetical protein
VNRRNFFKGLFSVAIAATAAPLVKVEGGGQPAMLAGLQTEAKKIDYQALTDEIFRAAGYPKGKSFIVDRTPQD